MNMNANIHLGDGKLSVQFFQTGSGIICMTIADLKGNEVCVYLSREQVEELSLALTERVAVLA